MKELTTNLKTGHLAALKGPYLMIFCHRRKKRETIFIHICITYIVVTEIDTVFPHIVSALE